MSPRLLLLASLALVGAGCATPTRSRGFIDDALRQRTGFGLAQAFAPVDAPEETALLDEEQAVRLALSQSPAFAADLTRLETARADFAQAARISNPRISLAGPLGSIRSAVGLLAPLLELIQLPQRTAAAARALEGVAESLVQSGLNLIRDVRVAYAEADLATRRLARLEELADLAEEVAAIAETRVAAGDLFPDQAIVARADAEGARDQVMVARRDREIAIARLRVFLGWEAGRDLMVRASRPLPDVVPALSDLLRVARADRPDVLAAELELRAAATRAGWERTRMVDLSATVDLQWDARNIGARVGGAAVLPIFDQNQGGRGRADAAVERATFRVDAVRQQVTLETVEARARLEQALDSLTRYTERVVPPLREALSAQSLRYDLGEEPYLPVALALERVARAEVRMLELEAEVRRALAELERAVGARLDVVGDGAPAGEE